MLQILKKEKMEGLMEEMMKGASCEKKKCGTFSQHFFAEFHFFHYVSSLTEIGVY